MTKAILLTLLSVGGSVLCTSETFACGGGACCAAASACVAPSCAAPAGGAAPADPHAGMNMTQTNRGSTYQSYSYEPGAARPMMSAPAPSYRTYRQPSSFYDTIRADKKVRGH